ncbi:hypothetical protein [Staphylococcus felis]|uniref:Uncharacterized protein n=1 Tax=Staphylococcus felis TaxID=46127 RepID=A0ABS0QMM2_9STAP|nr:hypothetical protein [Staphylococcus felis]
MDKKQVCENIEFLVDTLIENVPDYFKFHGETATELFLNDNLKIDTPIDICVNRRHIAELLRVIPKKYEITMIYQNGRNQQLEYIKLSQVHSLQVKKEDVLLLNIVIYDVDKDNWLFRLNHDIRLPEKQIYFHSIKWGVDYIKPEIVLMYALKKPLNPKNIEFYRHLIDKMSYFQYVILKTVVGEESLNKIIK